MFHTFAHSAIRTLVPVLVGAFAAWVSTYVTVPAALTEALTIAVMGTAAMGYYLGARWVERRFPSWSWLLGSPSQPVRYEAERPADAPTK